ncbi:HAD-IC family P-type ATPase [Corynebacterium epidermidicanis]|uniref:P-type ATPase, translocating n=1 Tax=Corynebacterium epidermidicanis TaxID=1050174 RepID=A0A0G3GN67_9CORY|nr:HAD-IC family P-type ATPase [Corynebacterium epidermidicanis]AKK02621.1 P-type ATPase, translocating [Corynebacterium epidermidicanis]
MSNATSLEGLSSADVDKRRADGLVNHPVRTTGRSVADIVRTNVFTRINAILAVLFSIVLVTGSWINGAFGLLIVVNSGIGIVQELRAKRTLDKLTILGESKPRVIRDGQSRQLNRDDIVLDDLIELSSGEQLVVDGVVRAAESLKVDESMLTGESDPVLKQVGDKVLSGSFVVAGQGAFQATEIGEDAYAAKLIREAGEFKLTDSELHQGIDRILKIITYLLVPVGALTIWTQLWRTHARPNDALLSMVAALVPMVPEGLVLMTSIAFAVGVVRLGRHNALINELKAIEALARISVLCADKTGTLTDNAMEFDQVQLLSTAPSAETETRVRTALATMAVADKHPNDTMRAIGAGVASEPASISAKVPFDSTRKWSGVSFENQNWVIGAPEMLTQDSDVLQRCAEISDSGLRVLLIGTTSSLGEELVGFEPVAVLSLQQKVRETAAETLAFFAAEDVDVKVISGDNADSVAAVAHRVGVEGAAFDARNLPADADAVTEIVREHDIFGRVTPEQKRMLVKNLQASGEFVAMTGDGVNDVLALKDSNIGIAMGAGSPAARSVAQVVLLDNDFATMPQVVAEGRRVIGNIERVANLFLTKTIYSVLIALVVGIWGLTYPFQPIHVTMIGWFTIGIPAFILSLAPNYERARPGFVRRVLLLALPAGLLIGAVTLGFWIWHYPGDVLDDHARQVSTATLLVLLIMAVWVLGVVARPLNWWRLALLGGSVAGYAVIFTVPALQRLLLLDASNVPLLIDAAIWGGLGATAIETATRIAQLLTRQFAEQGSRA